MQYPASYAVAGFKEHLQLHFLTGCAPELKPDELIQSCTKRIGTARRSLKTEGILTTRIDFELNRINNSARLVRSFSGHPSVAKFTHLGVISIHALMPKQPPPSRPQ